METKMRWKPLSSGTQHFWNDLFDIMKVKEALDSNTRASWMNQRQQSSWLLCVITHVRNRLKFNPLSTTRASQMSFTPFISLEPSLQFQKRNVQSKVSIWTRTKHHQDLPHSFNTIYARTKNILKSICVFFLLLIIFLF